MNADKTGAEKSKEVKRDGDEMARRDAGNDDGV